MASNRAQILISAIDQTKTAFDSIKRGLGGLTDVARGVNGVLANLGAAVSVAGLTAMVKSAIDTGDALDEIGPLQACDKVVSSLVLHQCPIAVKQAIIWQMWRLLKPGGALFIADYGEQRSLLMRMLFRQVQMIDGFELTEPNARGCLPAMLNAAGFRDVAELRVVPTPTGSISLYKGLR